MDLRRRRFIITTAIVASILAAGTLATFSASSTTDAPAPDFAARPAAFRPRGSTLKCSARLSGLR